VTAIPGSENDDSFWADRSEHDHTSRAIILPFALPQHTQGPSLRGLWWCQAPGNTRQGPVREGAWSSAARWTREPRGWGKARLSATQLEALESVQVLHQIVSSGTKLLLRWRGESIQAEKVEFWRRSKVPNQREKVLDQPMGKLRHWKSKSHLLEAEQGLAVLI